MSIRIKSKTYGPLMVASQTIASEMVAANASDAIATVSEGGHVVNVGLTPGPESSSPSDLLLSALGSCIYISLSMAASTLTFSVSDLKVRVTGEKAQSLPHRIESFNVRVSFYFDGSIEEREQILTKTKELCTISNTLGAAINLEYAMSL